MLQNVWQKKNVASVCAEPEKRYTFYLYKEGEEESLFPFA
jgi:hypothetical protein